MEVQFNISKTELDEIDAIGDEALDFITEFSSTQELEAVDVCGIINKVIPILEFVIKALKYFPFLGKLRRALKTAINILRTICP